MTRRSRRRNAERPNRTPLFSARGPGTPPRRRRWPAVLALVAGTAAAVLVIGWFDPGSLLSGKHEDSVRTLRATPAPAARSSRGDSGSGYAIHVDEGTEPVRVSFKVPPRAGLLFDLDSGRVLWSRNPTRRLSIASLTKMMTALVVVRNSSPHERVKITRQALAYTGSGIGVLPKRKRVQLEALMNGLLLVSGNDAAIALAQHVAGSVPMFVRRMNSVARRMGLRCTRFASPHGLERGNRSCAADLAVLGHADLRERRIARIARRTSVQPAVPVKSGRIWLNNNNPLIRLGYRGATGLKTGYTDDAGKCFVATARRGGVHLGVVLLRSPNIYIQARKLLNAGFRNARAS